MRYLQFVGAVGVLQAFISVAVYNEAQCQMRATHGYEKTTVGDKILIRNWGEPAFESELFEYRLLVTLHEENRVESQLYQPAGFLTDEQGCSYVADTGNARIAVFDPSGRFSHSMGRKGQGPGEFLTCRVDQVQGGVVWAFDLAQRRLSSWKTDGTLIETHRVPNQIGILGLARFAIQDNGHQVVVSYATDRSATQGEGIHAVAMIMNASGDTLWHEKTISIRTSVPTSIRISGREQTMPLPIPWGPQPCVAYHDEHGFLLSPGNRAELDYYTVTGKYRFHVTIDLAPEIVDRRAMRELRQSLEKDWESANVTMKPILRAQIDVLPSEATKAPWSKAEIDDYGFTWLQVPTRLMAPTLSESALSYRIISPAGEYLGVTTRPKGMFYSLADGKLMVTHINEDTSEYELSVYQIIPAQQDLEYTITPSGSFLNAYVDMPQTGRE